MKISKSHLAGFALGSLVTGIVCYFLLSRTTWVSSQPEASAPISAKPGKPSARTPQTAPVAEPPLTPDDIQTSATRAPALIRVPAGVINLLFDESVNFHDLTILPAWRQKLRLTKAQAGVVEKILREQVAKIGQIEAKTAKLETKPNGDASHTLACNPDAEPMRMEFAAELQKTLGPDYPDADFLGTALAHSRALSGFGSTPREVYITDHTLEGKTSTVVEITEQVGLDPKNQSSRAYTVSPEREFVKLLYPFLK